MEEEGEGGSCATRQNEQTRGIVVLKGPGSAGGAGDRCFVLACRRKKGREENKKGRGRRRLIRDGDGKRMI